MSGTDISQNSKKKPSRITSIESNGFWILTSIGEFFVSFERYPAFGQATVSQIFNFRESFGDFHWDALDIDIELDALKSPERYPLVFQEARQLAEKKAIYKKPSKRKT
jgi:hypothetical protein